MRFLVFMIPAVYQPKNSKQQNPDFSEDPKRTAKLMSAMGKFNDEVQKATTVHSVDGLAPIAKGARIAYAGGKPVVTDGPAVDSKEVVGGYWLVEAKTKQQVVDLWKRCPAEEGDVIEIRQVAEMSDFPVALQKALQEQAGAGKETTAAKKTPETGTKAPGPWKKSRGSRTKDQD
jgi:hypothetical protein